MPSGKDPDTLCDFEADRRFIRPIEPRFRERRFPGGRRWLARNGAAAGILAIVTLAWVNALYILLS
jgi:hypothetical protein